MSESPENTEAEQADVAQEAPPPVLTALLLETFGERIVEHHAQYGDETVVITREGMLEVMGFLKDDPRCAFEMMIDLTAVDRTPRDPRFDVVYHFKSLTHNHRLRVKVCIPEEGAQVDSIQGLWVAANWYERECHEMYGIDFADHPELEPLLLYKGFQGHPLRKDYDKGKMQPLMPLRPVRERYWYGETYQPVENPSTPGAMPIPGEDGEVEAAEAELIAQNEASSANPATPQQET